MQLVGPYMTTTNYKKRKQKPRTKAQQAQFEQSHKEYNKSMKRMGCHDQMMSLADYDLYVRGLYKPKLKGISKMPENKPYQRETKQYKSFGDGVGVATKVESPKYTGERKLLGIATMHKSNMVPIFEDNKHEAIEISRMRR